MRLRLLTLCHNKWITKPYMSNAFDQVTIYRRADAKSKEIGFVQMIADIIKHFGFNVDVAIG